MKKQIIGSLAATAALMAIAGIAQAAPAELNIYGASAQYDFWNAQAQHYAQTKLGCSAPTKQNTPDKKHGFVAATGCTSTLVPLNGSSRDLNIRYSGIASAEGPLAVKKLAPLDSSLLKLVTGFTTDSKPNYGASTCVVANGERAMFASATTEDCHVVHIGTSDVSGETLIQSSNGDKLGPNGGGTFSVGLSGVNTTGLTPYNTVVVPFGFFVNEAVTARQCTAGLTGNYCTADDQCYTGEKDASGNTIANGTCNSNFTTIKSISREQAAMIFSGQAADWSDFGAYFTPQQIVTCLRHAGSGTHSTLDFTVLNAGGTGWGTQLATLEDKTGFSGAKLIDGGAPQIWFNQGAGDEMNCVNGKDASNPNGSLKGAIGYADSDAAINVTNSSQHVKQLAYNGFYPTRTAIRNGLYDFYSPAMLYTNPANTPASGYNPNAVALDMVTYAQNPANIPASKANYWASVAEMNYFRDKVSKYPSFQGASVPVAP